MSLYFLPSFKSTGLSVLEKWFKTDFQDGGHGGHLGFWIWTILVLFDLQYKWPQYFLASLESVRLSVQEKKFKIDFQDGRHGGHLGFRIWMILAIWICKSLRCFLPSFKSIGLSVQEKKQKKKKKKKKKKIDFQDGGHGDHPGFLIGTVLATFDLQVNPMLPTKFQVNWPSGSGGEAKNRFSRWPPWRISWIPDWNDFSLIWSTSHPDASNQVSSQSAFWFRRRSEK